MMGEGQQARGCAALCWGAPKESRSQRLPWRGFRSVMAALRQAEDPFPQGSVDLMRYSAWLKLMTLSRVFN